MTDQRKGPDPDLSFHFVPGSFPCCPVCDNDIMVAQASCVITAHGSKALAHIMCVEEVFEDYNND